MYTKNLSRLHEIMYSVSKILLIMPVIWGGISNINIDSISIKINKVLRLIYNVKFEILRLIFKILDCKLKEIELYFDFVN